MREYILRDKASLELTDRIIEMDEASVKVKISKAAVTHTDRMQYYGQVGRFGIVPLRYAVGVVSDPQASAQFSRGERVYLDPYLPCSDCYFCKTEQRRFCARMEVMGSTVDGFLTEFKKLPEANLVALPENVSDEQALFIEPIARAIAIIDRLDLAKGDHIVIFGSDILSNILCQLALYYQAVPILVDDNELNLEAAKRCGVYYTIPSDAEAQRRVTEITGGRMAEKLVYMATSRFSTKNLFPTATYGARAAFTGLSQNNVTTNYHQALEKQLIVHYVANGYGNTFSAINMLVNKAVQTAGFLTSSAAFDEAPAAFEAFGELSPPASLMSATVVNL